MTGKPLLISGAKGQSSGPVASFRAASKPLSITAQITPVQSGSGDPSPTNVRPISGWSAVNVYHAGINYPKRDWQRGYVISSTTGELQQQPINEYYTSPLIPLTSEKKLYIDIQMGAAGYRYLTVCTYDVNGDYIETLYNAVKAKDAHVVADYTAGSTAAFIRMSCGAGSGTINYCTSDLSTVTITFPETIYGGTLAIAENGSVTLSVDRKLITVGNSGWTYCSPYIWKAFSDKATPPERGTAEYPLICSMLPYDGVKYASQISDVCCAQATNQNIYIKDTSCTSENEYYAKYSGATVLYYLATPQTYTLTPITPITALAGENNVWADSGDTLVNYIKQGLFYIS